MKNIFLLTFFITITSLSIAQSSVNNVKPAIDNLKDFLKVRDFTLTSSGSEAYFTLQSPLEEVCVIAGINKAGDQWGSPIIVSFSGKFLDLEPFLSPDGLRLYFVSNRPLEASQNEPKDFDIWYVERSASDEKWGEPINLGLPVNTEHNEFYPAITNAGNLYITSDRPDSKGQDDIFLCKWLGDKYQEPQSMSDAINTESYEFNAYVAPDESFLIFSGYNRDDGFGSGDMYISFRDNESNWGAAVNLGEDINSKYMDYCPYVDLNTMTLYFTSRRSSIQSIQNIQSLNDFKDVTNIYENGNSRIYKVDINLDDLRE